MQNLGMQHLGRFIVRDEATCHGQPIFMGTRILVADVLEQVAQGMAWPSIIEEWRGAVSHEAIAEAVSLARASLISPVPELLPQKLAA